MIPPDPRLMDRKIVNCVSMTDGTQESTYECGHTAVQIIPVPLGWNVVCAQCVSEYLEEWRAAKEKATA